MYEQYIGFIKYYVTASDDPVKKCLLLLEHTNLTAFLKENNMIFFALVAEAFVECYAVLFPFWFK